MPKLALPSALPLVRIGIVDRATLVAGCVDGDLGDRLARTGQWLRLAPSVYLAGPGPPTDGQLVEVLIGPGTRSVSSPYVVVHQSKRAASTWTSGGVRYVMPERAVIDGARRLTDLSAVRALVLGAVCRRFCLADDLRLEVESGWRRGSGLVRRAVDDAIAGAWSAPEAEAADLVSAAVRARRLPGFLLNPTLLLGDRRIGAPDGYVPGTGVGWQVDSRRHHSGDDDFDATLAAHDGYAAYGMTMLHVTPRRLRMLGPAWVDLLVAAVHANGAGEPAGLVVEPNGPVQDGLRRRALAPAR
ncbi:MAG: hypothetical protein KY451_12750 [Actinobacteria bacterium]|nr:hypothetical protein [Actinomycetota bacterium]